MNFPTDSPLIFGFPIATLWGARIRVSPFYFALLLLMVGKFGGAVGVVAFLILSISTLLHEYGHVFAARLTGGDADDVILWPLGGLALCRRAPTFQSEFFTAAAGPLVNLALSILTFSWVYSTTDLWTALHPLRIPQIELERGILHVLLMLTFTLNWKLFLLNLLPLIPLDGSSMLLAAARRRWEPIVARTSVLIASAAAHVLMAAVALSIDSSLGVALLFLTYALLPVTIVEWVRLQAASLIGFEIEDTENYERYGDDDEENSQRTPAPGLLERWKLERAEKEEQERIQAEAQLDALLEKVHLRGIDSLTESEKRFLKQASARYRGQSRPS